MVRDSCVCLCLIMLGQVAWPCGARALNSFDHPDQVAVGLERAHTVDLAGRWHFKEDPHDVGEGEGWFQPGQVRGRTGDVPLPWQLAFFPDLQDFIGAAWYEKAVEVPPAFAERRVTLCSYGIGNDARVWVNGRFAGEILDTQNSPFALDITAQIQPGQPNTLTIKVTDPDSGMLGSWTYNRASGLWQNLWLEATGRSFIGDIFMQPNIDTEQAVARITVIEPEDIAQTENGLSVTLIDPDGTTQDEVQAAVAAGAQQGVGRVIEIPLRIPSSSLWDTENPNLYRLEVALRSGNGDVIDEAATHFGMRKLEARGDRVFLNNRPIYLLGGGLDPGPYGGALDVNYHLPPPYRPLTDQQVRDEVLKIKSLGVNWVRCTLRPAPPRFLKWADRLGLLVWSEWPWYRDSAVDAEGNPSPTVKRKWTEIALRDRNHPSLMMWGMFNEGLPVPDPEKFITQMKAFLDRLNPYCFKLDSSGGRALSGLHFPENHILSDIDDVHWYPSFFHFDHLRELIGGTRSWGKPVAVTEFGPIPYIQNAAKIRRMWDGEFPGWAGAVASNYASYGETAPVEDRFKRWNLDRIWGSFDAFAEASDLYYGKGLKHQIELIRMNPQMCGLLPWVYESTPHPTGWIDYFGDKKAFADDLARIMTQDLIVVDILGRRNFWAGETVRADIHVSHFGADAVLEGAVEWSVEGLDARGWIEKVSVPAGQVRRVGEVTFRVPERSAAGAHRLIARLENVRGELVHENGIDVFLFPFDDRRPLVDSVAVHVTLGWRFQINGYKNVGPLLTTRVDETTTQVLESGGTVILLACPDMVPGFPHLTYRELDPSILPFLQSHGLDLGSAEQGAHGDTYFIKPEFELFQRIPYENPLAWPFRAVWPRRTILGMEAEDQDDMLAGAFGMMIGSRAYDSSGTARPGEVNATIAQFRYGKGRLIICTFNLLNPYLDDPVATIMLNDLIAYAHGDFEPKMRLK